MHKISLCMIIKNEENVLKRCLNSVKNIVDEIIIVDTGSTDNSKNIAKKYTEKIYDFDWCDDFAKARNFSFSLASFEYIMWLDADDIIPKSTQNKILDLKRNMLADTYMIKYKMLDRNNKTTLTFYRERIVRNCKYSTWNGCVHECITPFGKIEYLDYSIHHKKLSITNPKRNLRIYQNICNKRQLNTRELYYYARELYDNKHYKKSIKIFKKFLSKKDGWIENIIDAYYMIAKCFFNLNDINSTFKYIFKSMEYGRPKPDTCCLLGDIFLSTNHYDMSIYWYKISLNLKTKPNLMTFNYSLYQKEYPCLQLCYCYYNLGEINKSIYYNNLVLKHNKHNLIALRNKNFFDKSIQK